MPLICPICWNSLDSVYNTDAECVALECGHVFHNDCVMPWLLEHPTCAQCRAPVSDMSTGLAKIFFSSTDTSSSSDIDSLQRRLLKITEEKKELDREHEETETYANNLLDELVAHQKSVFELKSKLKELQREKAELSQRLRESEQLVSRQQHRLQRLEQMLDEGTRSATGTEGAAQEPPPPLLQPTIQLLPAMPLQLQAPLAPVAEPASAPLQRPQTPEPQSESQLTPEAPVELSQQDDKTESESPFASVSDFVYFF